MNSENSYTEFHPSYTQVSFSSGVLSHCTLTWIPKSASYRRQTIVIIILKWTHFSALGSEPEDKHGYSGALKSTLAAC